jgi:hypothetical protein
MSYRVTVPDKHVAIIVPVVLAGEVISLCRLERERLRKSRADNAKAHLSIYSDLQLAADDALTYSYQPGSK